ncbi:MAG: 3-oxoacyl-ACP synthase [Spirochaetes bacterium]|nr:3-oxoacyl-ACP synthase [Spirochaetota bacterium]MBU1081402.1 3-oxoacyl-ACP synthase [Spirochaetota bacterium]
MSGALDGAAVGAAPARIGIERLGYYMPETVQTSEYIARESGIPRDVIESKFGIKQRHRAGPGEQVSDLGVKACLEALGDFDPALVDLVVYCGSEYKDYYLFNVAAHVAHRIGAVNANAFEIHNLCSAGVWSLKVLKAMMQADPELRHVLLFTASKETDVVDLSNQRTRFMFNFGDGAAAALLKRDADKNIILETKMITDGRFAADVAVYGVGSKNWDGLETLDRPGRSLDVADPASMKERLDPISMANFVSVIEGAAAKSGYAGRIDFVAPIFMKSSILEGILGKLGLGLEDTFVLEDFGHCQSADAYVALVEGQKAGRLKPGDLAVMFGAGTGYTWAATAVKWGPAD